ncbi:hypothetical protein [Xenorhabdus sp. SGI246]|uniref:hypothetical protein n=1 Tax=Xenorhabdus sp. SGI246 TaxID=3158263 RepID=UPI00349F74F7
MSLPNNIGLRKTDLVTKQLKEYQSKFRNWWEERGPSEFLNMEMNLRLPNGSVLASNWSSYHKMKPSEYTWGIFVAPTNQKHIAFGEFIGKPVWETVPQDYRSLLFEHIRVQADVENAAIEQSRNLTLTAPSRFDLNNLFQFFLEEGRHTWAMVHLLIEYFGHDGIVESEALLDRMSGSDSNPRLLNAFNCHTDDWLSHFMWCFLADRVGKYQIQAVTQCSFSPLARSANFMMFEEPLHIQFGLKGLERVLCKSIEVTLESDSYDIFDKGAISLPVIQKYFNYWISKIFDLFGNDESNRAYELYECGVRSPRGFPPRNIEEIIQDKKHKNEIKQVTVKPELAINTIMRRQFIYEISKTFEHWNNYLELMGLNLKLYIPHERFNREYGPCNGLLFDIYGNTILPNSKITIKDYLPTIEEIDKVQNVMKMQIESGCYASWISPENFSLPKLLAKNN